MEAVRGTGCKVPVNDDDAAQLTEKLAEGLGWDKTHIHGGYIQQGRGREAIAVVLKVTPGLAQALMKESRKPVAEQLQAMQGWRIKRHMLASELRCVKAIWEQFGTELDAAKLATVLFKYIDGYSAVQIGNVTYRLSEEKLLALS